MIDHNVQPRTSVKTPSVPLNTGASFYPQQSSLGEPWFCPNTVQILIMDDEPAVCQLITTLLARPQFELDVLGDPEHMDEKLKERSYHLIVTDIPFGLYPARTVLQRLASEQPEASIIAMSDKPTVENLILAVKHRVCDFLTKPFDASELQEAVRKCLEDKGLIRLSEEALREALGATIRERRKALGLTLAQVAARTNISLGYLSQIELGKNSASIETLYRICLGLGIKMSELFQRIRS